MLVYWAMLLVGLALYGLTASDPQTLRSIVVGSLAGSFIGTLLALRDVRGGMAGVLVFFSMLWVTSIIPQELVGHHLWMAYVPAAVCAYWGLGDREALAAFWFPAMIWMLSILDRTGAKDFDRSSIAFVCVLGALFIVFLRVREARRAKLWQAFAPVPLAAPRAPQLLREAPGRHLARFAWTAVVAGAAIALTAWIAPQLWQLETSHAGHTSQTGAPSDVPRDISGYGGLASTDLPCCTLDPQIDVERTRVKEYFDLGRGHQTEASDGEQQQCRRCDGVEGGYAGGAPEMVVTTGGETVEGTPGGVESIGTTSGGGTIIDTSPAPSLGIGTIGAVTPTIETPPMVAAPTIIPPPSAPPPVVVQAPPPVLNDTPAQNNTAISTAPSAPTAAPPAPHVHLSANVAPPPPTTTAPMAQQEPSHIGGDILRILALLAAAGLVLQLVALALRPVRRAFTLRHLRRPFWTETVDQRVSNAWQLALVGLRDAGWCASSEEAPRQYASRVGVAGLEKCAVILERARHGLGIDADDLTEMTAAADEAYRGAREGIGPVAKLAAQLRWPLA
jgi:hypothetical protein